MSARRAVFERDKRGVWLVSVPDIPGCHSYGRSLQEARRNIAEAASLFTSAKSRVTLREEIRVPARFKRDVARVRRARERVQQQQTAANTELLRAARSLTQDAGLSLRDAGDLLGLSRQRVQQLVTASRSTAGSRTAGRGRSAA